jgi:hypothetical protein
LLPGTRMIPNGGGTVPSTTLPQNYQIGNCSRDENSHDASHALFTTAKADGSDVTLIRASNWNVKHVIALAITAVFGNYWLILEQN